jgi:outer membrane lipoprotein-sorting protein
MSIVVPSVVRRWLVPTSAALAVIGGGVAIGLVTKAADSSSVAPRSAEQLLTDLLTARPDGLQGTVAVRTDLGLPPLPLPTPGSADLTSLATGTHTVRVWYAGPDHARLALLGREGETDVITNGTDLWVWSSKENTAVHTTAPSRGSLADLLGGGLLGGPGGMPSGLPSGLPTALPSGLPGGLGLDPSALVRMALRVLEPSTAITTDTSASVAGRQAYELVLRPRDTSSLIDSIVIDIDAVEHFPLRFAILARDGGAPAVEVAFTDVSFDRPDDAQFTFNPPPGATVVDEPIDKSDSAAPEPEATEGHERPPFALVGEGWTTVVVVGVPGDAPDGELADVLAQLPRVSGDWGSGRLLSTRLFSVLLTDDGRALAGAVAPERLYQAAADPAAKLGR